MKTTTVTWKFAVRGIAFIISNECVDDRHPNFSPPASQKHSSKPFSQHHHNLRSHDQSLEATNGSNLLLQDSHLLLVSDWISRFTLERPLEQLIGVVRLEVRRQDLETLSVLGDLGPVALDVLQVLREVGIGALEDLAVDGIGHLRLDVDVGGVGAGGVAEDVVGGAFDGAQELLDSILVLGEEGVVCFTFALLANLLCKIRGWAKLKYQCTGWSRSSSIPIQRAGQYEASGHRLLDGLGSRATPPARPFARSRVQYQRRWSLR